MVCVLRIDDDDDVMIIIIIKHNLNDFKSLEIWWWLSNNLSSLSFWYVLGSILGLILQDFRGFPQVLQISARLATFTFDPIQFFHPFHILRYVTYTLEN